MKTTREFILEKPASHSGGDRYQENPGTEREIIGKIYIQQFYSRTPSTSRSKGKPVETLTLTIEIPD